MGSKFQFSIAYHPQTDGQSERLIQVLEDMLQSCVLEFIGRWECYLPLAEFAYNNSNQTSIKMIPFEALFGKGGQTYLCWIDLDEKRIVRSELVCKIKDNVKMICERLMAA